jgi:hypothetical protein
MAAYGGDRVSGGALLTVSTGRDTPTGAGGSGHPP